MSYYDQSLLARDQDFTDRVGAAAAVELEATAGAIPPDGWARQNVAWIAAAPGFADAYASALAGAVPDPGRDPSVISDAQILAAVQAHITATTPAPPP